MASNSKEDDKTVTETTSEVLKELLTTSDDHQVIDLENEVPNERKKRKLEEISKRPIPNLETLKSDVYLHFTWIDTIRQWKCNHCSSHYTHTTKGGSGSLSTHLKTKHPMKLSEAKKSSCLKDQPLESFYSRLEQPRKPIVEPITRDKFREKLIRFLVETDQSFVVVEEKSFVDLLEFCSSKNEKCTLVNGTNTTEWIKNMYTDEKQKLKTLLQSNDSKVSLILDGWTSSNQKAFQGVIACWIDHNWKLCHTVLDLTILKGEHSGENMAQALEVVLDEFQLWEKLLAITTDNASNMDTMFESIDQKAKDKMIEFRSDQHRVRCLAHIINLSSKAILNQLSTDFNEDFSEDEEQDDLQNIGVNVLKKIRRGIREIRRTPQRRENFEKFCERLQLPRKNLILDVQTRWNSTLHMLRRLIELKSAYSSCTSYTKDHITKESPIWNLLASLVDMLSPYEEATNMISQAHSPSLSDTAVVYHHLFEHLENYTDGKEKKLQSTRKKTHSENIVPVWQQEAAKAGWNKLQKYYTYCDQLVYVVATVFDPRYKLQWFRETWEKEYADAVKKKVNQLWSSKYAAKQISTEKSDSMEATSFNIGTIVSAKLKKFHATDDELKRYLSEPLINPSKLAGGISGALQWWQSHADEYPLLSKMAKDFLAVSATGVPVERLFSSGTDLVTQKRSCLKAETIKQCMCLKQWLKMKNSNNYSFENFPDAVMEKSGVSNLSWITDDE